MERELFGQYIGAANAFMSLDRRKTMQQNNDEILQKVRRECHVVDLALRNGWTLEQVIEFLFQQNKQLIEKNIQLYSIAPRKIKVHDKIYVWHAPDELIPLTELDIEI